MEPGFRKIEGCTVGPYDAAERLRTFQSLDQADPAFG